MAERTVLDFYRCELKAPKRDHYRHFTPDGVRTLSTEQFFAKVVGFAEGLAKLGIGRGDRVLLISDNRPEWHITDLAVLALGAVDVPVYSTLNPEQIAYQVNDSGARAVVVDSPQQMAKILAVSDRCPTLEHLIQMDGERADGVRRMEAIIAAGTVAGAEDRFWQRAAGVEPGDLMTIIYTSGTTGEPKGVMLTHDNLVQNVLNSAHRVPVSADDTALEFLPLCHVLERMVSYIYMWRGTRKTYCSVHHVGDLIAEIRPTLFAGVPRFFEKVHQKIMDKVAAASPVRRTLFNWALGVGREAAHQRIAGKELGAVLGASFNAADRLVLGTVREAFGGRVRYAISGGAELPLFVNEFFHSLGIKVIEGYGLTETSPVIAVNGVEPGTLRLGTVGKPLANLEVKLAEDGELLVRGPSVMTGYWNKPEATREVFDPDGFFHTGDIAEIDDDGFVLIVDRKKDLIVTAGGKNIAPQPVESQLKQSPWVDTAVLIGDRRPFVVALIVPNFEELERWAKSKGIEHSGAEDLISRPEVRQLYDQLVTATNSSQARYEQVKRFAILPTPLTMEAGHLTPTLKVKRRVVEERFKTTVDGLYA